MPLKLVIREECVRIWFLSPKIFQNKVGTYKKQLIMPRKVQRNKAIDFFRVNDSTISFHGNPLDFSDSLMHYKLTDYAANTVIFQTYHTIRYEVSTLRYNYATNKITFEQHNFDDHRNRYLKIEQ